GLPGGANHRQDGFVDGSKGENDLCWQPIAAGVLRDDESRTIPIIKTKVDVGCRVESGIGGMDGKEIIEAIASHGRAAIGSRETVDARGVDVGFECPFTIQIVESTSRHNMGFVTAD